MDIYCSPLLLHFLESHIVSSSHSKYHLLWFLAHLKVTPKDLCHLSEREIVTKLYHTDASKYTITVLNTTVFQNDAAFTWKLCSARHERIWSVCYFGCCFAGPVWLCTFLLLFILHDPISNLAYFWWVRQLNLPANQGSYWIQRLFLFQIIVSTSVESLRRLSYRILSLFCDKLICLPGQNTLIFIWQWMVLHADIS